MFGKEVALIVVGEPVQSEKGLWAGFAGSDRRRLNRKIPLHGLQVCDTMYTYKDGNFISFLLEGFIMRKVLALFMAAACVLGATVFSTPKAQTTGRVRAEARLFSPGNSLNLGAVAVEFTGNAFAVEVTYAIKLYSGKNYSGKVTKKTDDFNVTRTAYSNTWMKIGSSNSIISAVAYIGADDSKADMVKTTY